MFEREFNAEMHGQFKQLRLNIDGRITSQNAFAMNNVFI